MEQTTAGRKPKVTSEAIISAAWELFEKRGFAETTMAEIAEAVGISRRSIFNYFPSKEALLFPHEAEGAFVEEFRKRILARPANEKLFDSLRAVLAEMAPLSVGLASSQSAGPEVLKAKQTEAAIAYTRTYWATQMQEIALERLGNDPDASIKAGFVGALTGQVLTELGALLQSSGGKIKAAEAATRVIKSLQDLFD